MRRYAILTLALAACGESGTDPVLDPLAGAQLNIVEGANQTDTIEARLAPIVVQLATAAVGADPAGQLVNFRVVEEGCGEAWAGTALTDSNGRATDLWDLGAEVGTCTLEARVVDPDGTPRVLASTTATVGTGAAADGLFLLVAQGEVWSFLDSLAIEPDNYWLADRRGNGISWTVEVTSGPLEARGGWLVPTDIMGEASIRVITDRGLLTDAVAEVCQRPNLRLRVRISLSGYGC